MPATSLKLDSPVLYQLWRRLYITKVFSSKVYYKKNKPILFTIIFQKYILIFCWCSIMYKYFSNNNRKKNTTTKHCSTDDTQCYPSIHTLEKIVCSCICVIVGLFWALSIYLRKKPMILKENSCETNQSRIVITKRLGLHIEVAWKKYHTIHYLVNLVCSECMQ